jgi:voltage-gated potassium channel
MSLLGPAGAPGTLRARTYHVIFDHEDGWARAFDVGLILAIIASVLAVMLDSVTSLREGYGTLLLLVEWHFTIIFTIEYLLRLWCVKPPRAYALSFFGLIDLLAVIPTYLSLLLPGGQYLAVIRVLRVMRVFRVLKLARYVGEASVLGAALRAARYKIAVFLVGVLTIVVVVGSLMYLVEGAASGFTSIPRGVYWAIVTLTTVGYGDIAPTTPIGQTLASFVMILGYAIIAVPTGIVTAELTRRSYHDPLAARTCPACEHIEPDPSTAYCRWCGNSLAAD